MLCHGPWGGEMRRPAPSLCMFALRSWGGLLVTAAASCLLAANPAPASESACPWAWTDRVLNPGGHTVSQRLSFSVHASGEIGVRMAITFTVDEGSVLSRSEKTILSDIPGATVKDRHVKVTDELGRELASNCKWFTRELVQGSKQASWFKVLFEFPEPVCGSVSQLYTVYLEYTVLRGLCMETPGGPARFDFPWAHMWVTRVTDSSYQLEFPNRTSTELDMEGVCFGGSGVRPMCGTSRLDVLVNGSSAYCSLGGYVHAPYFKWGVPRAAEMAWGGASVERHCEGFKGPSSLAPGIEGEGNSTMAARTSLIVFIVGGAISGGLLGGWAVKRPRCTAKGSGKDLGDEAGNWCKVDLESVSYNLNPHCPGHSVSGGGSRHIAHIEATALADLRGVASPRNPDAIMPGGGVPPSVDKDIADNWEVMAEFDDVDIFDAPSTTMGGNTEPLGFISEAQLVPFEGAADSPCESHLLQECSSVPSEDCPIAELGDEDLSMEPTETDVEEDNIWSVDREFSRGELLELENTGPIASFAGPGHDRGTPKVRPSPPKIGTNIEPKGKPRHRFRPKFVVSSPSAAAVTPRTQAAGFRGLPFIPTALTYSRSESFGTGEGEDFDLDDSPSNAQAVRLDFPPDDFPPDDDDTESESMDFDLDDSPSPSRAVSWSPRPRDVP